MMLNAGDFLKLINLDPFKKSNNEAGVSVSRGVELAKLRDAVKEKRVNLRVLLKWLNASAGCRLQERWLTNFFANELGASQQRSGKSKEDKLKEEVNRLTELLRASQEQNQMIAMVASEDNQKSIFAGIVEKIELETQAEVAAFVEQAATRAKQKAIDQMKAIFPDWEPAEDA
ncbi:MULTISPECIES: hypothetical protein [Citrobacter]|uniref:hypothetical protein n=1 Tax=Citrobacter TaxID=544 RepID=UPI00109390BE|nr:MULTISPECIES: hypothetical protein [Citrobacter]MBD0827129.1 hypothetical protein [Citrobacter sp. C1]QMJ03753.1 hypothetical protein HVY06_11785 [Citrobacter freundii]QMJ12820.1 hypothetical protein HVY04_11785 [Citrobacter freundii]